MWEKIDCVYDVQIGDTISFIYDGGSRSGKIRVGLITNILRPYSFMLANIENTEPNSFEVYEELIGYRQYKLHLMHDIYVWKKEEQEKKISRIVPFEEVQNDIAFGATAEELAKAYKVIFPQYDIEWHGAIGKFIITEDISNQEDF